MRPSWRRLGSLASRRVLTNRMREYFTYGSVGGAGGNPGSYPAAPGHRATVPIDASRGPGRWSLDCRSHVPACPKVVKDPREKKLIKEQIMNEPENPSSESGLTAA